MESYTYPFLHPIPLAGDSISGFEDDEEFDESDVVWSSSSTTTTTITGEDTSAGAAVTTLPASPLSTSGGLSAALSLNGGGGISIQQRRNSPVAMISSQAVGSYYGRRFHQSAPVKVPVWGHKSNGGRHVTLIDEGEEEVYGEGEMVPPHEMVARPHKMTFSVFEGRGRTLKGRDLRAVRNTVFQKTGFLE